MSDPLHSSPLYQPPQVPLRTVRVFTVAGVAFDVPTNLTLGQLSLNVRGMGYLGGDFGFIWADKIIGIFEITPEMPLPRMLQPNTPTEGRA